MLWQFKFAVHICEWNLRYLRMFLTKRLYVTRKRDAHCFYINLSVSFAAIQVIQYSATNPSCSCMGLARSPSAQLNNPKESYVHV